MNGLGSLAGQPFKERPTSRIGQSFEDRIGRALHTQTITKRLWFVNAKFALFPRLSTDSPITKSQKNSHIHDESALQSQRD